MEFFSPFAFGAGMVALINPCGFALLPAYLGMFLGQKDDSTSRVASLNRAQGVGLALSLGIMVVFGLVGIVLGGLQSALAEILPYFNIALGVGLIALGIYMLAGKTITLSLPKLNKGGKSGSFSSMFLFGMSYAIASLTCTIGVFSAAVGVSSSTGGFTTQLGAFLSYGLGMGLLATVLTLLMALGKRELVNKFRALLPKINIFSAILLLLVGPYMIGYGIWEIQVFSDSGNEPTEWLNNFMLEASGIQSSLNNWFASPIDVFGWMTTRTAFLGWPFVAINVALVIAGFVVRRTNKADALEPEMELADA